MNICQFTVIKISFNRAVTVIKFNAYLKYTKNRI